jgi:hypothetical protein
MRRNLERFFILGHALISVLVRSSMRALIDASELAPSGLRGVFLCSSVRVLVVSFVAFQFFSVVCSTVAM